MREVSQTSVDGTPTQGSGVGHGRGRDDEAEAEDEEGGHAPPAAQPARQRP